MYNNVFKQLYSPWRYPSNWIGNIRLFFRRYKWAYQRAKRGYADCDIWDMDSWLLTLFHDSLNHLADNHCGWPGNEDFPEDEDWTKYLKEMAQLFYQAQESNEYYPTPEGDKWSAWLDEHPNGNWVDDMINDKPMKRYDGNANPYSKSMFEEDKENAKKRDADFRKAWDMMGKVFYSLWD
jgi:hypothetical protein